MVIIRETQRQVKKVFSTAFWLFTLLFGFVAVLFSTTTGRSDETTLTVPADGVWIAHADAPGGGYGGDSSDDGGDSHDVSDSTGGDTDGCFAPGTLITMADGSTKGVERIRPGDITLGGRVSGVMQFQVPTGSMYHYKGIWVTGTHPLNDEGVWRYVSESPRAVPAPDTENRLTYLFSCASHRVYVHGIEFSDFSELDKDDPIQKALFRQRIQHHQRREDARRSIVAQTYFQSLTARRSIS